jgi:photosystem II stability/assembly factor-like uncharacterized protein
MHQLRRALPLLVLLLTHSGPGLAKNEDPDQKSELGALKFRSIGPNISGRVGRIAGVPGDPHTLYAAVVHGGVWKSTNAGRNWESVFDDQFTQSMGSIAVAPSEPSVVYAGSGEGNPRGNVSLGWGIWKSTDAGKTWSHVWRNRGQIGTMEVHPSNADIAFAAVLGSPFGPSDTRGVYRTRDGGKTWQRVLFANADTGAADVTFDPNNPNILFASLWQFRRQPWIATSGGPGSGLYRSTDGGDTWKKLEGSGLPEGEMGKIGVRVAPSDSSRVYALIEHKDGGLFRSDDGGGSWTRINAHRTLRQRAWYYAVLTIDPSNADVVWFPQVNLLRTIDGGKTVQSVKGPQHGDHHDIWVDPRDHLRLVSGNDGGIDISDDGGKTWYSPQMPTAQFYNIDVDDRVPYHVGGTIQDWGTASGPSQIRRDGGGASLGDWHVVGGGEAGDFKYVPGAPGHVYAGEYGGYLSHYIEGTGQFRNISIYPANPSGIAAEKMTYRFQWTAPLEVSPHDPNVVYHGGNVLFRSADRGASWTAISPDLTRNDKSKQQWSGGPITGDITGVEYYNTLFSIEESPVAAGVIWTGSDDGLVHVTRDGGANWNNVTSKAWPQWGTVEGLEASRADAGTAYVVVDAHRLDDERPYLFRTRDYGKSWQALANNLPADLHLFVVREDPADANMLYLGTERGIWYSRDAGARWHELKNAGLPPVIVPDIELKHGDLIAGTRRGIWILEDVAVLRTLERAKANAAHLFPVRDATRWRGDYRWDGGNVANSPYGAAITYWLKDETKEDITLDVLDANGAVIRTLSSVVVPARYPPDDADDPQEAPKAALSRDAGVNRAVWDLRHRGGKRLAGAKVDAGDPEIGPLALPGRYTLRLKVGTATYETSVNVLADARAGVSADDLKQNFDFAIAARDKLDRTVDMIDALRAMREQVRDIHTRTEKDAAAADVRATASTLITACDALEGKLHNPAAEVWYDILAGREGGAKFYSQLSPLYSWAQNSDHAPTQGMRERYAELSAELDRYEAEFAALKAGDLARLESQLAELKLPHVIVP